ncbi:hypothetical protein AGMMS49938_13850 [Fibrobacterales bacterium]|nr:hypothetical protein AGMMS49938_13850 [Fibrobacterales bacterium]
MIIANPIYDKAFKRLLENERVACFFIGTILGETVLSAKPGVKEHTRFDDDGNLTMMHLDFEATIATENGESKTILIEMQKSNSVADIGRFRRYLGDQYSQKDQTSGENRFLPITTIYVLDFCLPGINTACLKVSREYTDLIENKPVTGKTLFVENLTHDSFVVQVPLISNIPKQKVRTRLGELLGVFEQTGFTEKEKEIKDFKQPIVSEEIKDIVNILHYVGTDPAERKELDEEAYYRRYYEFSYGDVGRKLAEKIMILAEKDSALAEKDSALAEKDSALAEKDSAIAEKDSEIETLRKKLAEFEGRG